MTTLGVPAATLRVVLALAIAATTVGIDAAPSAASTSPQDQIIDAQMLVYEINLARSNPDAFRTKASDITMPAGIPPAPPLAISPTLGSSAGFKANEMADHGYFAHQSAVTGIWPNRLARDHGYPLPSFLSDTVNNIESLHGGSPDPFRVLVSFANSESHRRHIFGEGSFFGSHRQIGVGRSANQNYWAVHTAYISTGDVFITGVVYADSNGNGRMDRGEGLAGVTVSVGSASTVTNAGGGYAIKVAPGAHTVTASGGPYSGTTAVGVMVSDSNVGVDFVSGVGAVTASGASSYPFSDIAGSPYADEIAWLAEAGITRGCNPPENTRFCPDRLVTRAEMATFLTRAFGLQPSEANGPFTDHLSSSHRSAINAIRIAGITVGCNPPDNTRFCPRGSLTRAEIATFVARYANLPTPGANHYSDVAGHWGQGPINAVAQAGIAWSCPTSNSAFCPNSRVTRAEMAAWLHRAWQRGYLPNL